jgi:hypothetical protein
MGESGKVQSSSTVDLVAVLRAKRDGRFCLLTHPGRRTNTPIERVTETAFDAMKNATKYAMHVVSARGECLRRDERQSRDTFCRETRDS